MIKSIRNKCHKGLKALYKRQDESKLPAHDIETILDILSRLNKATVPLDMNYPGSDYHPLSKKLKGFYSVSVRANWKIIFKFDGKDVVDVDYVDYH